MLEEKLPENGEFPFPWYYKLAMKISPRLFFKLVMRKTDQDDGMIDAAERLFREKKLHFRPLRGQDGMRGLVMMIDNKMTLHFYQNGDHFGYDGFEIGEYEDGDVTVFDKQA